MAESTGESNRRFILEHTELQSPPLVPEIKLHAAGKVTRLWGETELRAAAGAAKIALPPPYWAFAWPGGQALARYLLDRRNSVAAKRVLDFGAGSGLVAIAAAKAGAAHVEVAEIDPLAAAAIALNAAANDVHIACFNNDVIGSETRWDTVLAGDMCYERPLAERLTNWLRRLASEGVTVLIGDPGRSYFPESGVTRVASYTVPTSLDLEDREARETSVYRLAP